MKYLVVFVLALLFVSCNEQSTSFNGNVSKARWAIPGRRAHFYYSLTGRSTTNLQATGLLIDTVLMVDSSRQSYTVTLQSVGFAGLQPHLQNDGQWLRYSGENLLFHLQSGFDDMPIRLPLARDDYSEERDTTITSAGFFISAGKRLEVDSKLGESTATIRNKSFNTIQFRAVNDLFDTLEAPSSQLDTTEVDFAPDLGYFTRMQETRYYLKPGEFYAYQIIATLDSVVYPK